MPEIHQENQKSRLTVAAVLLVVSLVVGLVGVALALWARTGLTAHLYLPASKWLAPPEAMSPLGPPSTEGLERGLRVTLAKESWRASDTEVEAMTGVTRFKSNWPNPFEARWRGYLLVDEPGDYVFHIWGEQDVSLALNGRPLGGFHTPWHRMDVPLSDEIRVPLEPGLHSLAIDHRGHGRPRTDSALLNMEWTPPGGERATIPEDRLWADRSAAAWERRHPEPHLLPDAPERAELSPGHLAGIPMARPGMLKSRAFYAAYIDNWDHHRFRVMSHFPGYEVLWRGRLRVSEDRVHSIVAETEGAVRIWIGERGAKAAAGEGGVTWRGKLEPGWHDLTVSFVSPWAKSSLSLVWDGEGSELEPISATRFRPAQEDLIWFAGRRRLAAGVLGIGVVGLLLALAWLGSTGNLRPAAVAAGTRRGAYALGIILIMLLGLGMRLYRYNEVPDLLLSSDEFHNARKGWHMLHGEGLRAWTPTRFLEFYEEDQIETVQWADLSWSRVRPNFDRPPLFPLLLGVFNATVGRAESVWDLGPGLFRLFPIFLSLLAIPLVGALTRRFYGSRAAALLAALLYASVPAIVLNHRQAKSDLLVVLFVLVGLLAAFRHLETRRRAWLVAAGVAAGLACWSKEIGIVALAIIPYMWLRERRWREGLTVAALGAGTFGLYFAWGSWVDFGIFWSIIRGQASQASGFDAAWIFLTQSRSVQVILPFAAGWTLWLWISAAYAAPRDRLPPLAAVSFLILISGIVRIDWIFGWYWVPMFPFLCMTGGLFLYDLLRRPELVKGGLFVLTALFMALHALRGGGVEDLAVTRGAIAICLGPFALATFFPHPRLIAATRSWAALVVLGTLALGILQFIRFE